MDSSLPWTYVPTILSMCACLSRVKCDTSSIASFLVIVCLPQVIVLRASKIRRHFTLWTTAVRVLPRFSWTCSKSLMRSRSSFWNRACCPRPDQFCSAMASTGHSFWIWSSWAYSSSLPPAVRHENWSWHVMFTHSRSSPKKNPFRRAPGCDKAEWNVVSDTPVAEW